MMIPISGHHNSGRCTAIAELIDHYVSGELGPDDVLEVQEHAALCPNCAAEIDTRMRLRRRLQQAMSTEAAPDVLLASIQETVRTVPQVAGTPILRLNAFRWYYAAAALMVVIVGGWGIARLTELQTPTVTMIESSGSPNVAKAMTVLQIGLGDHVACAMRRAKEKPPMTSEAMANAVGNGYTGLLPIVKKHTAGCELLAAHRCKHKGRDFVHLILRSGDQIMSVMVTGKQGESFEATGCKPHCKVKEIPLFQAHLDDNRQFEVTGFETRKYLVFIVSDGASDTSNVRYASALAPEVQAFLEPS